MYLGNIKLRKSGELIDYTEEMQQEVIRCKEDIIYFAEKYFTIVTIDDGTKIITLHDFQKKMLKAMVNPPKDKNGIIIKIGRQSGKTTVASIYLLWKTLFHRDKTVAILANKEKTSIEILDRIKKAFLNLPLWLQQGIAEGGWNKTSIIFENGSRIFISGTSSDSISGFTVSDLYIDEFSKIPNHIAEEFITSTYPVISSGKTSKIIIASTPLGLNHFYEFWSKAVRGENSFFPIKVNYWEVPGRDAEWKQKMIKDIGNMRFKQEYMCANSQTIVTIRDKATKIEKKIKICDLFNDNIYK